MMISVSILFCMGSTVTQTKDTLSILFRVKSTKVNTNTPLHRDAIISTYAAHIKKLFPLPILHLGNIVAVMVTRGMGDSPILGEHHVLWISGFEHFKLK